MVSSMMADKDYPLMVSMLAPLAEKVFTVTPDNPRALDAAEYAAVLADVGVDATAYASVADAVSAGKALAAEKNIPLVCLGSLYMYAEIYDFLK